MNRLYSFAIPLLIASSGGVTSYDGVASIPTIPTIPTLATPGSPASGIVALDDGTVYFVDTFSSTVWRLQQGAPLDAFVSGRNGRTLHVDHGGRIYGTHEDEDGRVVTWRVDAKGRMDELPHPAVPQYGHPFVVEDDGDVLRTAGASIERVSRNGAVQTIARGERLLKPRHAFLARLFGQVHGHLTSIAVGASGEIYVANSARNAVIRIDRDGSADEVVRSDDGWTPTGVAAAGGMLYILEYGRGVRVRRIDGSGTLSTVALVKRERPVAAAALPGRLSAWVNG